MEWAGLAGRDRVVVDDDEFRESKIEDINSFWGFKGVVRDSSLPELLEMS